MQSRQERKTEEGRLGEHEQARLGQALKAHYAIALPATLPDRFRELLERINRKTGDAGDAEDRRPDQDNPTKR